MHGLYLATHGLNFAVGGRKTCLHLVTKRRESLLHSLLEAGHLVAHRLHLDLETLDLAVYPFELGRNYILERLLEGFVCSAQGHRSTTLS